MTIIQKPGETEFTGRMCDLVIDSDKTIDVEVRYNGKGVVSEKYSPDATNMIRLRRLHNLCNLCMWGRSLGYLGEQDTAAGVFSFYVDGTQVAQSTLYYSAFMRRQSPMELGVFTDCPKRSTYRGAPELATGIPMTRTNSEGATEYYVSIQATLSDDSQVSGDKQLFMAGSLRYAYTLSVSVEDVESYLGVSNVVEYSIGFTGGSCLFRVEEFPVEDVGSLRFRNLYDMPEIAHFTGGCSLSAANESEAAEVSGIRRKFGIKVNDEYKVSSGGISFGSEYRLWRDLCNSSEVEIWSEEYGWVPVTITKHKLEIDAFRKEFKEAELTLTIAEQRMNGLNDILI